jgi:nucleoside-diphosphate-sugar epimerase
MRPVAADEREFQMVNVGATAELARRAAAAQVARFVFLSSIKVNGEAREVPFTAADEPAPQDHYARSKWKAEEALRTVADSMSLDTVTVRPPLVYGPGVGANFRKLLGLAYTGWPLPFGSINNRRSLISVWNLADCLWHAATTQELRGRTWLVSDGTDLSTAQLIATMARAMHRRTHLWHVPLALLRAGGTLLGRRAEIDRLVNSLAVNAAETRRITGWQPPFSVEEGIAKTADWYLEQRRAHH